jgi:hypothetical protein
MFGQTSLRRSWGRGSLLSKLILLHQHLSAVNLSQEDQLLGFNKITCLELVEINSTW